MCSLCKIDEADGTTQANGTHSLLAFLLQKYVKQLLQQLFDHILLLYTQFWAPDDGRKDRPKHVGATSLKGF